MTKNSKEDPDKLAVEMLFPGRSISVDASRGITAIVYPPGIVHIRQFSRDIVSGVMAIVGSMTTNKGAAQAEKTKALLAQLVPFVLTNLIDLVGECTRLECKAAPNLKLADLPHYLVPPIVQAWVEESFIGENKLLPWKAAIEALIEKATGKPTSISEMVSNFSSPPATPAKTSSSTGSPGAHTPDGA